MITIDIKIEVKNKDFEMPKALIDAASGDELVARIFYNRGYKNPETVKQMLDESLYIPTEIEEFPDMDIAVARIARAIHDNEKILVYGDYDVDGVTSTVTLVEALRILNSDVCYHVPDRFTEGYGMNEGVIRENAKKGIKLIITCDCGVSNVNEITVAKSLGMDVVVTDHHNLPDVLPPADVILNPKILEEGHRARNISGCAMAYFLCIGLYRHFNLSEMADKSLDLLALSLVADVVSLNGENRYLLKKAMPKLFSSSREGLIELFGVIEQKARIDTEEDIAFQIAPRINAAGRMESARLPVEMLLSTNFIEAGVMARRIDELNEERKKIQQQIIDQAIQMVEDKKKNQTVLVLFGQHWHHGIVGIAAGKVCEKYRKPAILLSLKEDGQTLVGSARSTDDINIYELIKACSGKLIKFGGHAAAAGLSLNKDDVESFTAEIEEEAEKHYYIKDEINIEVDDELNIEEIDEELLKRIMSAGPYGEGFEAPFFVSKKLSVLNDRKTEKNHHIMVLSDEKDLRIQAVKWFGEDENLQNRVFDVVYKIGKNSYKGHESIQLNIAYLKGSEGKVVNAFKGTIIDARKTEFKKLIDGLKSPEYFYEGLKINCPVENSMNRRISANNKRCSELVFISTPVNTSVFREAISLLNPERVIISFQIVPDYSFKGFIMNLMGIIKHIVAERKMDYPVEDLSVLLGIEENVLKVALKYLKSLGKLSYFIDEGLVSMFFENKPPESNYFEHEKNLKDALLEKKAYQKFILELEINKFVEYLK